MVYNYFQGKCSDFILKTCDTDKLDFSIHLCLAFYVHGLLFPSFGTFIYMIKLVLLLENDPNRRGFCWQS